MKITDRYLRKVAKRLLMYRRINENSCWIWTGSRTKDGYGKSSFLGKAVKTHRVAAFVWLKGFSEFDNACHKEICSSRLCFNPDHLYAGTQSENMLDSVKIKTHCQSRKTQCPKGHSLEGDNLYLHKGHRQCNICRNARNRARYRYVEGY